MPNKYYIFREPESFDKLKADGLPLRYRVFRDSRLINFVDENEVCVDLDCYDLYSRHFILYEHEELNSRPVGYVRMVTEKNGSFFDEINNFVKSIPSLYEKVSRAPQEPFPLLCYFPEADVVKQFCEVVKSRGEILVEASRLSLDKSVRGDKLATFFISSLSAAFIANGADEAIMTCVPQHRGFYSKFNFKQVEGTHECYNDYLNIHDVCLNASAKHLSDGIREKILYMVDSYKQFRSICYDPSNPDNYNPPLGSFIKNRPASVPVAA